MEEQRRYRFLEDNPAVSQPGWLPPAAEVPELAHLRADHDRLLDAVRETGRKVRELHGKQRDELEAQRAAHEASFLGQSVEVPSLTVSDDELAAAGALAEAARDALQTFVQAAVVELRDEHEEPILVRLDETVRAAAAKRAEAQAILAEAEAMEAGGRKLRDWIGRATGRNHLGQYPYEQLAAPGPRDVAQDVTIGELYEAANPAIGFTDNLDDDAAGAAFGTDDPNNLDGDERPWERALSEEELIA